MTSITVEELQNLKNLDDKFIIAHVQYSLRDSAQSSNNFKQEFIEQTIVNPLKSTYGQIGSAKFQVKLLKFNDIKQTVDIKMEASQFTEFWAAFILNKSIGSVAYKVKLLSMQLLQNEDEIDDGSDDMQE
ncbi:hypothetical protein ABPG72_018705 [Tetrahymena utriculariae]